MDIAELYKIYQEHPLITTDSRDCPEGSIFVALKGESFDGNKFAAAALDKGCAYAIVDEAEYAKEGDDRYIVVDNCLRTFQRLAREHRRQFHIPVIGITGTNGKTTTKELVSAVLAMRYNVLHTEGNFNNDVGVPKTLFRLGQEHEIAVVEMGASHPGDIKTLVELVEPEYGIITNVGKAHLQGFGSFEGVVRTKGELYDFLRGQAGSTVFIDAGNEHLNGIAHDLRLVSYGVGNGGAAIEGEVISCAPMLKFRWHSKGMTGYGDKDVAANGWHEVQTHLIGSYNIYNMLAAASIGLYFGVTAEQIDEALTHYVPSNNRSQLTITEHNRLIVDAYNANPTSMAAALKNFRDMEVSPKMAILGQMGELGESSVEEHRRIIDTLMAYGIKDVWLVGDNYAPFDCPFRKFHDVEEVKAEIARQQPQGHYILIKGSNSVKLSQLPPLL